jgi:Protein of unknown function (DUF4232)
VRPWLVAVAFALLPTVFAGASAQRAAAETAPAAPACVREALRFAISDDSPGMGHVGILMSLRNASPAACHLPSWIFEAFWSARGKLVAAAPTAGDVALAPGAAAYSHVTWSDGTGGNTPCADAVKIVVTFEYERSGFTHPLPAHMCAVDGVTPSFTPYAFSLTKDPVPLPAPSTSPVQSASP